MIEFNLYEKQIVVAILFAIMEADGVIDPHETDYLDNMLTTLNISESDLDEIDEFDFNQVISGFKRFDEEKKVYARSIFLEMAKCDGFVDPRELEIINKLGA